MVPDSGVVEIGPNAAVSTPGWLVLTLTDPVP